MKDLVKKAGLGEALTVASAACRATLGKDITGKAKAILEQYKIPFEEHKAAQFTAADYAMYDYIIGFDQNNVDDIREEMKRRLEVALKGLRSYEAGAVEANNSADASLFGMYDDQRKYLRVIEFD